MANQDLIVTLRVSAKRLPDLLTVSTDIAQLVSVTIDTSAPAEPARQQHYAGGKRNISSLLAEGTVRQVGAGRYALPGVIIHKGATAS